MIKRSGLVLVSRTGELFVWKKVYFIWFLMRWLVCVDSRTVVMEVDIC